MLASDLGGFVPSYDDAAFEVEMERREAEFQRLRAELLDGPPYHGLVTRDFLAHERALYERVLVAEPELLRAEARARMAVISTEDAVVASQLAPRARRLEATAIAASAGEGETLIHAILSTSPSSSGSAWTADMTERWQLLLRCGGAVIVGAEGGERFARASILGDEAAAFSTLTDPESVKQRVESARAAQATREAAEAAARAAVGDVELSGRRDVVLSEGKAFAAIQFAFAREHAEVILRLQWQLQNAEARGRWDIEAVEKEAWFEGVVPEVTAAETAFAALVAAAAAEQRHSAAERTAAGAVEGLCAALFAAAPADPVLRLVSLEDTSGLGISTAGSFTGRVQGLYEAEDPDVAISHSKRGSLPAASPAAAAAAAEVHAAVSLLSPPPAPPTAAMRLATAQRRIDAAWSLL